MVRSLCCEYWGEGPPSFPNALYLGGWNGSEALPLSPRQPSPGNAKKRTSRSIAKRQQRIKQQKPAIPAGFCMHDKADCRKIRLLPVLSCRTNEDGKPPPAGSISRESMARGNLPPLREYTKRSKAFRCGVAKAATTIDRMRFPPFPASPEADAQGERGEDKFHLNLPAGAHETSSSLRGETYPAPPKAGTQRYAFGKRCTREIPEKRLGMPFEQTLRGRKKASSPEHF